MIFINIREVMHTVRTRGMHSLDEPSVAILNQSRTNNLTTLPY